MSIYNKVQKTIQPWLTPPQCRDGEGDENACLLYPILLAALPVSVVASVVLITLGKQLSSYGTLCAVGMLLISTILLRRGHVAISTALLLFTTLLVTAYLQLVGKGLFDVAIILHPILILLASLLVSPRRFLFFTGFSFLTLGVVIYGHLGGWLNSRGLGSSELFFNGLFAELLLFMAALAGYLIARNIRQKITRIQQSEEQYRELVQSVHSIILRWDRFGTIVFVNAYGLQVFGYEEGEITGKPVLGTIVPESEQGGRDLRVLMEDILLFPDRYNNNVNQNMCKDGHLVWVEWKNSVVRGDDGRVVEIYSVGTDITERIQAEVEQKRLQEHLHQAQKMDVIGQLSGGIAHDFNNMLAGIIASAEVLKRRLKDDERNLKPVATILQAAHRSADLTRQLLAFSRKKQIMFMPVSIHETIFSVIALLERTLGKNIRIETSLQAKNYVVTGDAALLQNALLNLAVNARDAMPEGGTLRVLTADVYLDDPNVLTQPFDISPGHFLELSLSDTGIGMTAEVLEHVFEPFFTTKERGKGTGLGLAAVYGTIRDHHGAINIYSEPGCSIFKVYLPLSNESVTTLVDDKTINGCGCILIVDDEPILRSGGRDLLEELGYTVLLAESGERALEIFAQEHSQIQLVLLDMIMPGLSGKETYLRLRERDQDVRVLFCSGFNSEGTSDELIGLGAKGFIQKPYSGAMLSRSVAEAIVV